jgi:hypothetical protein
MQKRRKRDAKEMQKRCKRDGVEVRDPQNAKKGEGKADEQNGSD